MSSTTDRSWYGMPGEVEADLLMRLAILQGETANMNNNGLREYAANYLKHMRKEGPKPEQPEGVSDAAALSVRRTAEAAHLGDPFA